MNPETLCKLRVTSDYRANQNTNTNIPQSKPSDAYEHTLDQAKRHIQTHPRPNQKTNANTPQSKPKDKYKHTLEQTKRQI